MEADEAGGRLNPGFTEVDAPLDSFDGSVIFNVATSVLGFILYMHQQIPSILEDLTFEFETLNMEYHELELILSQTEAKASSRRMHAGKMREVKFGIKRLEKLMNAVSSVQTALQCIMNEIPHVQRIMLVLGASPIRPQHVYEMYFSHGSIAPWCACDFSKSKAAEGLSRKAIRALISKGAGSDTCQGVGPSKLFLLVEAPSSLNLPLHFLPKRDFRYSKKIVPFRLQFKCRSQGQKRDAPQCDYETAGSVNSSESVLNDMIWFQCRHVIKGLNFRTSSEE